MVNAMVERATSNMLIGPDWAMNIEICDVCNQDPVQAKEIVKGIKKRLQSRNPKTQLLALTLLETIVKNCTEIIHMHVAEKELPRDMVKMVKKKPDFRVKEKILVLIDTWQEAFGGPRGRYPQFFAAYQELTRLGVVFPQRLASSTPLFTPPQTHPLKTLPQNRNPESAPEAAQSSAEAEFPTLSMEEIQNARGIMDVLAEMLNALDPGNKEGAKQETIVDLVEQCRSFKHRVVHLVNSTTDESLLSQGLALNDDLQRILAKHESIASGTTSAHLEKTKTDPDQPVVNVEAPLIDTGDDNQSNNGPASTTGLETQLLLPAPPVTNGQLTVPTNSNTNIDLLSWDGFNSPAESSLAIVPAEEPQPGAPVTSQQNTLAILDMYTQSDSNQLSNSTGHAKALSPQTLQDATVQSPQASFYPNGSISDTFPPTGQQPYSQGLDSAWNGPTTQQQQPVSPIYGAESSTAFPPPPWEAQPDNTQPAITEPYQLQPPYPSPNGLYLPGSDNTTSNQAGGMYMQPAVNNETFGGLHQNQQPVVGMYPQGIQPVQMGHMYPQQMYGNQMAGYGYGYVYQQNGQFLETSMSGLMVGDANASRNLSRPVPPGKPLRPEDKLFGDLVDISKFKPGKTA